MTRDELEAALAKAREDGRREVWAYVQSISALLPAGEEFWSEKRDVYIIDTTKFHALLTEKEDVDE